jgi:hypothetical protein
MLSKIIIVESMEDYGYYELNDWVASQLFDINGKGIVDEHGYVNMTLKEVKDVLKMEVNDMVRVGENTTVKRIV